MKLDEIKIDMDIEGYCDIRAKADCTICDNYLEVEGDNDELMQTMAEEAKARGWAIMHSDQYGQVGLACPGCIKKERHWEIDQEASRKHEEIDNGS